MTNWTKVAIPIAGIVVAALCLIGLVWSGSKPGTPATKEKTPMPGPTETPHGGQIPPIKTKTATFALG
jgi:hypothetical protein